MHAFAAQGEANARFLRRYHAYFCKTLARRYFGAASTFAAVCLDAHGTGEVANVGDSRIYHVDRSRKWLQISHDHTLFAEMQSRGEVPKDTLAEHYVGVYHSLALVWRLIPRTTACRPSCGGAIAAGR